MPRTRLIVFSTCLGALFSLTNCAAPTSSTGTGGQSGSSGPGTGGDAAGAAGSSGTTGSGGNSAGQAGTTGSGGSVSSRGGTTGAAGNSAGQAGTTGSGGNSSGAAGNGGSSGSPGSGGNVSSRGGTTGVGGSTAGSTGTGGTSSARGGAGGTAVPMDQNGVPIAKAGDTVTTSGSKTGGYLNLGDMRLINNRWGSDALHCTGSMESVVITTSKLVGWDFNRPACGGMRADPDFPEIEFGVAPFGTSSSNLTTPPFSSTTLLPIQIASLSSATLQFTNFTTSITSNTTTSYWDHNFEFWISKLDPTKNADAQVYAEIIIFLGWEPNRQNGNANPPGWSCSVPTAVSVGNFSLCHQSDSWGTAPKWRFFNYIDNGNGSGALPSYGQKVDIKALLQGITGKYTGFTSDMWLTRIEVGTEVDDSTVGNVRMSNLTFEINGTSKSFTIQ